jgi:hypothetical protein
MVGGKKNRSGGRIEGSGLFELASSRPDFVNEVTLLHYFTEQRSGTAGCQLMLIRSPKCHPELAIHTQINQGTVGGCHLYPKNFLSSVGFCCLRYDILFENNNGEGKETNQSKLQLQQSATMLVQRKLSWRRARIHQFLFPS